MREAVENGLLPAPRVITVLTAGVNESLSFEVQACAGEEAVTLNLK